jgi:hypothetical protein
MRDKLVLSKNPKTQRFKSIFRCRRQSIIVQRCSETTPRGKRSGKHTTNETPRSLSQKFRPKSFDELVGQNVVVRSLLGAVSK